MPDNKKKTSGKLKTAAVGKGSSRKPNESNDHAVSERNQGAPEKETRRISFKPGNMLYPLPAVMVSCRKPGEKANIVTVAWTGTICSDPAMVYISLRPQRLSHEIISNTGEFVINLVNRDLTRSMDFCGVRSGRDVDKFETCGLDEADSLTVSAPSIARSPVCIECRVTKVIPLGSHDMFLAEVTAVTVDPRYMDEKGRFHLNDSDLTAYSHGEYFSLGDELGKFGYSVKKNSTEGKPAVSKKQDAGKKQTVVKKQTTAKKQAAAKKQPAAKKQTAVKKQTAAKKRTAAKKQSAPK